MKLHFMALAEDVIIDSRTNRTSIISLIEEIPSPQFPILFPAPTIIASFERQEGDDEHCSCNVVFRIGEIEIVRSELAVNFSGSDRVRSLIDMNALVVPQPGTLVLELQKDGNLLGSWEVIVHQIREIKAETFPTGTIVKRPMPRESRSRTRKGAARKQEA